ncbi:MAG: glycosyltransferase family 9 protein [Bacteroidota bacterium]
MKLFEKNNILIARFSSIGDVVLTTPLLRAIKEQVPDSKITYIATKPMACLLEGNPFIDKLFLFDKSDSNRQIQILKRDILRANNSQKYNIAVDLQNNLRSKIMLSGLYENKISYNKYRLYKLSLVHLKWLIRKPKHVVDRYFETIALLNVLNKNYKTEIFVHNKEASKQKNEKLIFGIAHGAQHFTKQWLPEYFAELMKLISSQYQAQFYLFGNKNEIENSNIITNLFNVNVENFTGKLSLSDTINKISECDYFISNDTGLMHIASALQKPIVAIFGSTVPELGFTPYGVKNIISQVSLNCRPCSHIGRSNCPKKHFNCMKKITPHQVFSDLQNLINIQ